MMMVILHGNSFVCGALALLSYLVNEAIPWHVEREKGRLDNYNKC
jgi:hypothetical protein